MNKFEQGINVAFGMPLPPTNFPKVITAVCVCSAYSGHHPPSAVDILLLHPMTPVRCALHTQQTDSYPILVTWRSCALNLYILPEHIFCCHVSHKPKECKSYFLPPLLIPWVGLSSSFSSFPLTLSLSFLNSLILCAL